MKTLIIVCAIAFVSVSNSLDLCFVIFLHIHVTSLVGERREGGVTNDSCAGVAKYVPTYGGEVKVPRV